MAGRMGHGNRAPREQSGPDGSLSNLETSLPRARAIDTASKRERLAHIIDLMVAKRWERGVTAVELAEEWELAQSTVEGYASEASHLLALWREPEAVKEVCIANLMRVISESGQDRVQAIRTALEATGNLTKMHKVDVSVAERPSAELYPAALNAPGFRDWLIGQGWTPPRAMLEAHGEEVR